MNKNYMKEVAKLLGVELGEEFRIEGSPIECSFKFSDEGLIVDNAKGPLQEVLLLKRLLTGKVKIIKLHWKPQKGDSYYIP